MSSSILSIGKSVPPFKANQSDLISFMSRYLGSDKVTRRKIQVLFGLSGIESRYSILPDFTATEDEFEFFPRNADLEPFPSTNVRMEQYQKHALKLSMEAVADCMATSGREVTDITHLVTVSCTGMYAPGLDIELVEKMHLNSTVERTAINFMGCYAAFNALKVANNIVQSQPGSLVLVVAVELCSLHFQKGQTDEILTSNALFGDGAAAVLIGSKTQKPSLSLDEFHSDLALQGKEEMGWFIRDVGFEMKLTNEVPAIIRDGIKKLTTGLLDKLGMDLSQINYFAIHPGGRRILEVIENTLGITSQQNHHARDIMKDYGNMSSATVLFVLDHLWNTLSPQDNGKRILSFAFGPGLTMESMLLSVRY